MISFDSLPTTLGDGSTSTRRRALLELGSCGVLGLSWPTLLAAADTRETSDAAGFGQAKSCVVIFLWGGPAQQDTWDMKPEASSSLRSDFRPIATRVPGIEIGDQLPQMAQVTDRLAIVRSMTHRDFEHGTAAYTALTGHPHPVPGTNTTARPEDFPTYGSIVSRVGHNPHPVPDSIVLGPVMHQGNRPPIAGQNSGFLGLAYEPFRIADDPNRADFRVDSLKSVAGLPADRLRKRHRLLQSFDTSGPRVEPVRQVSGLDDLYQRAFGLLGSRETRGAFRLDSEPAALRDRYGRHRFGQTLLLCRRLVKVGVPLITVNWSKQNRDQWDTHAKNSSRLKNLLPPFDRGLATFLADLQDHGLLDSTLVVCLGEFGRTPWINKDAGRDHWPDCYSVVLAGGGIQSGTVFGASSRHASYPTVYPVGPWDLSATMFHCLGIPPHQQIRNRRGQPIPLSVGQVIDGLLV
ncbi:MAG: hypothetical protein CMJ65_02955 [Planctomycetaceae bacterium]|jgi:hypothetical protein|nr:hypothetical protein [Planctomycetaceae bacterium]